jgi:hypothetical protein
MMSTPVGDQGGAMKRNTLIAIAVGSVLGAALPAAYAQQAAVAPSQNSPQSAATSQAGSAPDWRGQNPGQGQDADSNGYRRADRDDDRDHWDHDRDHWDRDRDHAWDHDRDHAWDHDHDRWDQNWGSEDHSRDGHMTGAQPQTGGTVSQAAGTPSQTTGTPSQTTGAAPQTTQTTNNARDRALQRDIARDERDMAHDRADMRADRRDMWQERQDIRRDERDLRHDYAAQRAGMNEQGDISRDQADMRADRRQMARDRANMHADEREIRSDQRDMRSDRQDLRADATGADVRDAPHDLRNARDGDLRADRMDQRTAKDWEPAGQRTTTDVHTNAAPGMGVSQRVNVSATQTAGRQQGVSPTALASNATSESNKSPATQTAHEAWYHYLWPW